MWIKSVRVYGFGKLQGSYEFAPSSTNIICQQNEFGKSTLVDAILYTLYRFPISGSDGKSPGAQYRPWGGESTNKPSRVEIELIGIGSEDYLVSCEFGERQVFEATNLATGQITPIVESSFGKAFLHMSLPVFTQCFFLRQDDGASSAKDDLVELIESVAAATHRVQQVPANSALDVLENYRLPGIEPGWQAETPAKLIGSIDRRIGECEAAIAALNVDAQQIRPQVEETEALAAESEELQVNQCDLEYALASAELREIDEMIAWHDLQGEEAVNGALTAALERFDPAKKTQVQAIWTRMEELASEARDKRRRLDEDVVEGLRRLGERQAGDVAVDVPTAEQLERFRSLASTLRDRRAEIHTQRTQLEEMRHKLTAQGLTPDSYDQMKRLCEHLPPADTRILLEYDSRSAELEGMLADAQKLQSEAAGKATAARTARQKLRARCTMFFIAAAVLCAIAVLLFITKQVWKGGLPAGIAMMLCAGAAAIAGALQTRKVQQHSMSEVEPAMSDEIRTSSETRRLAEQLDNLRLAFKETVQRLHLGWDDTQLIRRVGRWSDTLVPHQAAEQYLTRLESGYADAAQDLVSQLAAAGVTLDAADLDKDGALEKALENLEKGVFCSIEREELDREGAELMARLEQIDAEVRECEHLLTDILGDDHQGGNSFELRVMEYVAGCERVETMRGAIRHDSSVPLPSAQELRDRAANLRRRMKEEWAAAGLHVLPLYENMPRSVIEERLRILQSRREEIRLTRESAFQQCDDVITRSRTELLRLRGEIARLQRQKRKALKAMKAIETSQQILREAISTTMINWTSALNEAVKDVLPALNPAYCDVQFSESLELSLFSKEHGRRLSAGEISCLSKGARDQLHLAVRVAISQFLASHLGTLPIVLDEPFAHWDDARFVDGMRFLRELSKRHQVVLLSCHQWRYEELQRRHPDLAEDLRFCEIAPFEEVPQVVSNSLQ